MIFVMTIGSLCWSSVSTSYQQSESNSNIYTWELHNINNKKYLKSLGLSFTFFRNDDFAEKKRVAKINKYNVWCDVMIRLSLGKYNDNRWHRRVIDDRVVTNIPWGNKIMIKIDRRWWWQSAGMHAEWLWVCIRLWLQAIISSFVTPPRIKNTNLEYKYKALFN